MTNPLYDMSTTVYLRESAALGKLEPMRINGIHLGQAGWMYSVGAAMSPPSAGGPLDRRSNVNTAVLYYSESEFLTLCDALVLVEANAKSAYDRAKSQRQSYCPDELTSGD